MCIKEDVKNGGSKEMDIIIIMGIPMIVIYVLILIVMVLVNQTADVLLLIVDKGLLIICIIMGIKNLVQDIGFVIIKYKEYIYGLISIPINLFRIVYFYYIVSCASNLLDGGLARLGLLKYYGRVFDFFFILFAGSAFFFCSEYCAVALARDDCSIGELDFESPLGCIIGNILMTGIFVLLFEFLFPSLH